MRTLVPLLLLLKGLKPTEESGKAGKFNYPSVSTDGKREPAARGEPRLINLLKTQKAPTINIANAFQKLNLYTNYSTTNILSLTAILSPAVI